MEHTKIFDADNKLQKAGGLILRDSAGEKELLLVYSVTHGWTFPKGHLEENETLEGAAVRECKEETGLEVRVIKKLPVLEYQNQRTRDHITVHLYQMKVVGGELQIEHEDNRLEWFSLETAEKIVDYQNLSEYLKSIKKFL